MSVARCAHCGGFKGVRTAARLCRCEHVTLAEPVPVIPEDLRLVEEDTGHDPYNAHSDIGYRSRRPRRSSR